MIGKNTNTLESLAEYNRQNLEQAQKITGDVLLGGLVYKILQHQAVVSRVFVRTPTDNAGNSMSSVYGCSCGWRSQPTLDDSMSKLSFDIWEKFCREDEHANTWPWRLYFWPAQALGRALGKICQAKYWAQALLHKASHIPDPALHWYTSRKIEKAYKKLLDAYRASLNP